MRRSPFVVLCAALLLICSASAFAASKRVGVPKFEGQKEALVRKAVMKALKAHGYELVKSRGMDDASASTGAHPDSDDGVKTLAKELALSAIITGEVGARRAKIIVHDGAEGSVLGDASFAGANPRKLAVAVGHDFWGKLGADIGRGQVPKGAKKGQKAAAEDSADDNEESSDAEDSGGAAPMAEKAKPAAESAEGGAASGDAPMPHKKKAKPKMESAPEDGSESKPSAYPWVDVEVGFGGLNRGLSYNQDRSNPPLLPYTLGFGPVVTGKVVLYPVAPFDGGALADLGLDIAIENGFVSSKQSGSGGFSNIVHDFGGGLRYRFPFAAADEIYVSGTGGEHAFTFNGANRGTLNIPDTIYHYIRPGVGMRLMVTDAISVSLGGGYRYIFNQAGVQFSGSHYFPHLTVAGADVELGVGYALSDNFELRAGVSWRRYWYAMHSTVADATAGMKIAGGALDQYIAATVGIAFRYGSSAPKTEGGEEAPPPPPPKAKGKRKHGGDSDDESEGDAGGDSDSGGDSGGSKKSGGDPDL